jgi:hypothetical protein
MLLLIQNVQRIANQKKYQLNRWKDNKLVSIYYMR